MIAAVKGDLAAARAHFDEAIRLEPTIWAAYYNRAIISSIEQKWELALQDLNFETAIGQFRTAIIVFMTPRYYRIRSRQKSVMTFSNKSLHANNKAF